jgi:hypothetical protein
MSNKIERLNSVTSQITVTASASTSPKVPFGAAGGGVFIVDSVAGGATTLAWHVAFNPEATPQPLHNSSGAVTTAIVASRAYAIPDEAFAAPYIVAVTNAGTASIRISVKG